jgi:hypothetical protein
VGHRIAGALRNTRRLVALVGSSRYLSQSFHGSRQLSGSFRISRISSPITKLSWMGYGAAMHPARIPRRFTSTVPWLEMGWNVVNWSTAWAVFGLHWIVAQAAQYRNDPARIVLTHRNDPCKRRPRPCGRRR